MTVAHRTLLLGFGFQRHSCWLNAKVSQEIPRTKGSWLSITLLSVLGRISLMPPLCSSPTAAPLARVFSTRNPIILWFPMTSASHTKTIPLLTLPLMDLHKILPSPSYHQSPKSWKTVSCGFHSFKRSHLCQMYLQSDACLCPSIFPPAGLCSLCLSSWNSTAASSSLSTPSLLLALLPPYPSPTSPSRPISSIWTKLPVLYLATCTYNILLL